MNGQFVGGTSNKSATKTSVYNIVSDFIDDKQAIIKDLPAIASKKRLMTAYINLMLADKTVPTKDYNFSSKANVNKALSKGDDASVSIAKKILKQLNKTYKSLRDAKNHPYAAKIVKKLLENNESDAKKYYATNDKGGNKKPVKDGDDESDDQEEEDEDEDQNDSQDDEDSSSSSD